jgi:hypothetical protein
VRVADVFPEVFEGEEYARRTEKVVAHALHEESDEKATNIVETRDRV